MSGLTATQRDVFVCLHGVGFMPQYRHSLDGYRHNPAHDWPPFPYTTPFSIRHAMRLVLKHVFASLLPPYFLQLRENIFPFACSHAAFTDECSKEPSVAHQSKYTCAPAIFALLLGSRRLGVNVYDKLK